MRGALALPPPCGRGRPPADRLVVGSTASDGRYSINGGNFFLTHGKPGVYFGTVKSPDKAQSCAYVVLLEGLPAGVGGLAGLSGHDAPGGPRRRALRGNAGRESVDLTQGRAFRFDVPSGALRRAEGALPPLKPGEELRARGEALLNALK